jgi:hypothetical protein
LARALPQRLAKRKLPSYQTYSTQRLHQQKRQLLILETQNISLKHEDILDSSDVVCTDIHLKPGTCAIYTPGHLPRDGIIKNVKSNVKKKTFKYVQSRPALLRIFKVQFRIAILRTTGRAPHTQFTYIGIHVHIHLFRHNFSTRGMRFFSLGKLGLLEEWDMGGDVTGHEHGMAQKERGVRWAVWVV